MILGLTGTNASGKTSVVNYFKSRGFAYYSLSDVIRDELTHQGLEHSRDNLRRVGNELRRLYGPAVLAIKITNQISSANVVIDSIRNVHEIDELHKLDNFFLIAIDAPPEIRFKRANSRGRLENAPTLQKFLELENKEKSRDQTAQNIDLCMEQADFKIYNDKHISNLYEKLDQLMARLSDK